MLVELSDLRIPEQTMENEGVDFACLSRRSSGGQLNYCDSFPFQFRNLEEST